MPPMFSAKWSAETIVAFFYFCYVIYQNYLNKSICSLLKKKKIFLQFTIEALGAIHEFIRPFCSLFTTIGVQIVKILP
jgi:hypothetical protein